VQRDPGVLFDSLTLGSSWTFVGGKGGVGKTTLAAALAIQLADRGARVLVLSSDPAHSLGDALGMELAGEPRDVTGVPGLEALEIDPHAEHRKFLDAHRSTLIDLMRRGSLLDEDDLSAVADLSLPGTDELAALFRLLELSADPDRRVVVDTAPTGHTLRLLDLPELARGWLTALGSLEEKQSAVALALAGVYQPSEAAVQIAVLQEDLERFSALIRDPARTRFILVTNPEPVVLAETHRYADALTARGIALGGMIVNRATAPDRASSGDDGVVRVPRLPSDPRGVDALRQLSAQAWKRPAPADPVEPAGARLRVGDAFGVAPGPTLYLVGGKGGVGKTTAASALAALLASELQAAVLLLSIDPAGSLSDVLATPVSREPAPVPGVPRLYAQQLAAEAAWARFRSEISAEAERLAGGILGGTGSAVGPTSVQQWTGLAPPGIDEVMALLEVIDLVSGETYDALVVDTAPTGHLLRLLELPAIALEWVRTLLRVLLKYREVVGLGQLARRLLALSRDLRRLENVLRDPKSTSLLVVALPEELSVPETRRLIERARQLRINPAVLILNRALDADAAESIRGLSVARQLALAAGDTPLVATPDLHPGPIGATEVAAFGRAWRWLERTGP
jgi:arsenite/tail-anchored protein-transporting ATPase